MQYNKVCTQEVTLSLTNMLEYELCSFTKTSRVFNTYVRQSNKQCYLF